MQKQKNNQMIIILLLSIALLTMSVGFAAFSTNLSIGGNVTIKGESWKVEFDTTSYEETTNSNVTVSNENLTISGTSIVYNVNLSSPGDKYEFTIDVLNTGTLDAKLSNITLTELSEDVSKYLKYTVTYNDTDSTLASDIALQKINGLATVKVTVEYINPENEEDLPDDNVEVSLLCALNYVQA